MTKSPANFQIAMSGAIVLAMGLPSMSAAAPLPATPTLTYENGLQPAFATGQPRVPPLVIEDEEPDHFDKKTENHPNLVPVTIGSVSPEATAFIVGEIERARRVCSQIPRIYRHQCLEWEFRKLAEKISRNGDYEEAAEILETAARKIKVATRPHIDRAAPRIKVAEPGPAATPEAPTPPRPPKPTGPIAAVKPEAVDELDAVVEDIIEEAATQLLRSAETSEARRLSYLEIAEAVDSTKVLLRS